MAACGGGGGGEPLVSGAVSGSFAGDAFTADVGIATVYMDEPLIGLGTGNLDCDSPNHDEPPSGVTAIIANDFTVGDYTDVFIELDKVSGGDFNGIGAGGGSVSIIASTATSIAGTVDWSYVDDTDGTMYSLTGPFEVVNCQ